MATVFESSVQGQEAISIAQMLTVGQACEHLSELTAASEAKQLCLADL